MSAMLVVPPLYSTAIRSSVPNHTYLSLPASIPATSSSDQRAEETLTAEGWRQCMKLVTEHQLFTALNSHLSPNEIAGVRHWPPRWPGFKPVFSPYVSAKE